VNRSEDKNAKADPHDGSFGHGRDLAWFRTRWTWSFHGRVVIPSKSSCPAVADRLAGSLPSHHQLIKADNSAPVPPDAEEAKVDEMIKSICRGC